MTVRLPRCPECGWDDNGRLMACLHDFGGGSYLQGDDNETTVTQCPSCDCDAPMREWLSVQDVVA